MKSCSRSSASSFATSWLLGLVSVFTLSTLPAWGQSTCPTGFRDVQIVNACDNELWLGQQVASVGGQPGSGQSAQSCLTNTDCASYPNSYCNQGVMCLANSDCNNFQLTNGLHQQQRLLERAFRFYLPSWGCPPTVLGRLQYRQ